MWADLILALVLMRAPKHAQHHTRSHVSRSESRRPLTTMWDRVAACESGGNWQRNTGNGFYGGLQFTVSTWLGFGGSNYATRADLASKGAQITVANRVLASQGWGAWPVCGLG